MREKNMFETVVQQLAQRFPHLFRIRTILGGKEGETVRAEVDQCVADDDRPAVARAMERDLAQCRALDADDRDLLPNASSRGEFRYPWEIQFRLRFAIRKNRDRKSLGKRGAGTSMIRISRDDADDPSAAESLLKTRRGGGERIDQNDPGGGSQAGGEKVRFHSRIIPVPDKQVWT